MEYLISDIETFSGDGARVFSDDREIFEGRIEEGMTVQVYHSGELFEHIPWRGCLRERRARAVEYFGYYFSGYSGCRNTRCKPRFKLLRIHFADTGAPRMP